MDLAIVIVNWNGKELLARCLRSIAETAGSLEHSVWVVDNASSDGSAALVAAEFPHVRLVASAENHGFAGGNNVALRAIYANGGCDHLLLLNPDTVVQPGSLQNLLRYMRAHPAVGAAGARLLNEDYSFQASFNPLPTLRQEFLILSALGRRLYGDWYPSAGPTASQVSRENVGYVVGACIIARLDAAQQVGLLDEGFFMYSEEVDWCARFHQHGWRVGYVADAPIVHLGGGSTRQVRAKMLAELYRSRVRFFSKHYGPLRALALRALLLTMNGLKLLRAKLRPSATGTAPLSWPLLRHAVGLSTPETRRPHAPSR